MNFGALFFGFIVVFRVKKFILLIKFLFESFSGHQGWQILTSGQVLFLLLDHSCAFGHRMCLSTDWSLDCLFLDVPWTFYVAAPIILWADDKVWFLGQLWYGVSDGGQLWGFFQKTFERGRIAPLEHSGLVLSRQFRYFKVRRVFKQPIFLRLSFVFLVISYAWSVCILGASGSFSLLKLYWDFAVINCLFLFYLDRSLNLYNWSGGFLIDFDRYWLRLWSLLSTLVVWFW